MSSWVIRIKRDGNDYWEDSATCSLVNNQDLETSEEVLEYYLKTANWNISHSKLPEVEITKTSPGVTIYKPIKRDTKLSKLGYEEA